MPDPITAMVVGTIGSSAANIFGSQAAAKAQTKNAQLAMQQQREMLNQGLITQKEYYDNATKALSGIADQGQGVYSDLVNQLPDLTAPINLTQDWLESTPGYQFALKQGLRGVDMSAISRGMSGAQAKGAAQFATGLADQTYQTQFNAANTNKTNAFNRLLQTAQTGATAAGQLGSLGTSAGNQALSSATSTGKNLSDVQVGIGNAQAAADIATGKNVGNILSAPSSAWLSTNPWTTAAPSQAAASGMYERRGGIGSA